MFLRSGREDTNFAYVSAGWKATVTTGTIERHSLGNEKRSWAYRENKS